MLISGLPRAYSTLRLASGTRLVGKWQQGGKGGNNVLKQSLVAHVLKWPWCALLVGHNEQALKAPKEPKSFASRPGFWSNTCNFLNKGGWRPVHLVALISTLENSQMKKTLIAMAAVAVAGVASAQVTLTGKLSYGYSTNHSNKEASGTNAAGTGKLATPGTQAAKDVAGFGVHDGHFTMSGSEDLGGGLSATASMEVLSRGRDTAISGRNASLTVSGGFGSVMMGAIEAGNGIMGLGQAGAPGVGMDGKVLSGAANVDIFKYTLPNLMEGLTLAVNMTDAPGNTTGRSAGYTQGYAAAFASGAFSASIDYTDYKNTKSTAATKGSLSLAAAPHTLLAYDATEVIPAGATIFKAAKAAANGADNRNRMSFSYDLGVAKVGYGRQIVSYLPSAAGAAVNDNVQTTMGVSVPVGALTLGLATAQSQSDGSSTKTTGTDFGIKYALSKRTAVDFGRVSWGKNTDSEKNKYQRIRLTHTF